MNLIYVCFEDKLHSNSIIVVIIKGITITTSPLIVALIKIVKLIIIKTTVTITAFFPLHRVRWERGRYKLQDRIGNRS